MSLRFTGTAWKCTSFFILSQSLCFQQLVVGPKNPHMWMGRSWKRFQIYRRKKIPCSWTSLHSGPSSKQKHSEAEQEVSFTRLKTVAFWGCLCTCLYNTGGTSLRISTAIIKHHEQKQLWGRKGLSLTSRSQSITERRQGRISRQKPWDMIWTEVEAIVNRLPGLLRLLSHTTQGDTFPRWAGPSYINHQSSKCTTASPVGHFLNRGSLLKNNNIKLAALERATVSISCDFGRVIFGVTSW